MLDYPEIKTIVAQMNAELIGKTVESGMMVNKNNNLFMFEYPAAQYDLLRGGTVTRIEDLGEEIYLMLDNGYGILFCACGGKILYNKSKPLDKHNIIFHFTDGSSLTYTMMLCTMGIYAISHEDWQNRVKVSKKFDPLGNHSFRNYIDFIKGKTDEETKRPVKIFLAKNVSGVGSSFAAEMLLYAKVHPSIQLRKLSDEQHKRVYESMKSVLTSACDKGGRVNEFNLYGIKGNYIAMAERKHIGEDCPVCGNVLGKISVGGVTAFCPNCQVKTKV